MRFVHHPLPLGGIALGLVLAGLSVTPGASRGASPSSSGSPGPAARDSRLYDEVTAEVGIRHRHRRPVLDGKLTAIMPWMTALGAAACTTDYDRDGRLDLYVGNYFRDHDLWQLQETRIMHDSFETSRNGGVNELFRQGADGSFTEVARKAGADSTGWTLAAGAGDLDGDGWPDLYLAEDFGTDQVFLNRGPGPDGVTFDNVSEVAIGIDTEKGMNVDFGDHDNDGRLDVYVTNITTDRFVREGNMLWHNDGPDEAGRPTFTDVAGETGTFHGGWGWGAKFFDADLDGDLDLVATNGFVSAGPEEYWPVIYSWRRGGADHEDARNWPPFGDRSYSGYETLRFFRNQGYSTFTDEAEEVGLASDRDQRGVVVFDYDDDGDLDLFLANQGQPPQLFRHRGVPDRHWLMVELVGDPAHGTTRDAVGTRVTVWTEAGRQIRERDGGNSFAGQSDPRIHFGLGESETVERLEVRWPDGGVQVLEDVAADRHLTIPQDPKTYASPARADSSSSISTRRSSSSVR